MSPNGPDLWAARHSLEALRERSLTPTFAPWRRRFLDALDEEIDKPAHGDARTLAGIAERAAFAHVLTGRPEYRDHAVRSLTLACTGDQPWADPRHAEMYPEDRADLGLAETTKASANVLSWLWSEIDDGERCRIATALADRGGRVIYEDAEAGCWWADALNSNWTSVLNSALGFAGLVWRHYNEAEGDRWVERARGVIARMLDLAADEGAGVEGAGYWLYCFGSAQDLVEALANELGDGLHSHPFWAQCSRFLPYQTLPDMSGWVPYADTGRGPLSGSAFFHGVASRTSDPFAQWFGNEILRRTDDASWKSLAYYDDSVPEQPIDELPPCRHFPSIHLASFRSGWDPDAVMMLFKGGSNAWSHTHLDLNSFFIAAGTEKLATDPGPEPYSVDLWHSVEPAVSTAWHNCIVVDGAHQRMGAQHAMSFDLEEAGDCYSRLSDHLSSESFEMIRGDATSAYGDTLERAWRDVIYVKPDTSIIFDDLRAAPARVQRNFEWMLHSEVPIVEEDGLIEAQGEHARLLIQPLFPQGWEWKQVKGKAIPRSDDELHCISVRPYWHHKWNVDPSRSPYPHWDPRGDSQPLYSDECRFLVVLQAVTPGRVAWEVGALEQGQAKGVRLSTDGEECVALFNHSGETVAVGDVQTDAEKTILRVRDGHVSWGVVRATELVCGGRVLHASAERASVVGEHRS